MLDSQAKYLEKYPTIIGFVHPGEGTFSHGCIRDLVRLIG
jgi:hypothetical protein